MLTFHSFSSPTLKVVVGEEGNEEKFWVHQNILTSHSEFFKRATNGQWLESDERLVTLPEDRPDVFRLYLNLLYTKQIATKTWITLCQIYVLAEKLQDTSAKDSAIDAMHAALQEYAPKKPRLGFKSITELYSGTPEGSKVRKFVADYVADEGHDSWLKDPESGSSLPPEFVLDVAATLFRKCPKSGWKQISTMLQPAEHYHEGVAACENEKEAEATKD
ncbi:hypothetical protein N0V83_008140 [Neocucurbitaria cava]|uniref:BTB domain-containing protein n=1 Tax=Neocucurbitaria cava TaxID=798079 RepID=A0A9W8Y4J6_9PLEO|nr:hypothetical protein N0V83_008140 [Neocucurbitaria cava]